MRIQHCVYELNLNYQSIKPKDAKKYLKIRKTANYARLLQSITFTTDVSFTRIKLHM